MEVNYYVNFFKTEKITQVKKNLLILIKLVEFYEVCVYPRHLNIKKMVAGKTSQGNSGEGI